MQVAGASLDEAAVEASLDDDPLDRNRRGVVYGESFERLASVERRTASFRPLVRRILHACESAADRQRIGDGRRFVHVVVGDREPHLGLRVVLDGLERRLDVGEGVRPARAVHPAVGPLAHVDHMRSAALAVVRREFTCHLSLRIVRDVACPGSRNFNRDGEYRPGLEILQRLPLDDIAV